MRQDIPLANQVVQVGHACLEAGWRFPAPAAPCNLVVLAVPDQRALLAVQDRLDAAAIAYVRFLEPDDDFGLTAVCTAPLSGAARRLFRRYPLWSVDTLAHLARGPPCVLTGSLFVPFDVDSV